MRPRPILKRMENLIQRLSPRLFWDVDASQVQSDRHARWILERVLERGNWQDWIAVRDHFGKAGLRAMKPGLRIDPKAKNFLEIYCQP